MFSILFTERQNESTEAQTTAASSFYNFITNAQSMGKLEALIQEKEQELDYIEKLTTLYEEVGCKALLESAAIKYNKLREESLRLQLKKNKLERELILFELETLEK
jgi:hypothetical protein